VRLLLDTHIWIWSQIEPERLAARVIRALEAPGTELWVSPISVWECLLLVERGRLTLGIDAHTWIETAWTGAGLREAPLTRAVALRSRDVKLPHQDPADRFLAATAQVHDLTLVTDDRYLLGAKGFGKLSNR